MPLQPEDDGSVSVTNPDQLFEEPGTIAPPPDEPAAAPVQASAEPKQDEPPASGFDPAAQAKVFADALKQAGFTAPAAAPAAAAAPTITPEQARQLLNVEIDDATLEELDNLSTRKAAWQKVLDRTLKAAETRAQVALFKQQQEWREEQERQQQEMVRRETEQEFATQYPELAKPELTPMLAGISQSFLTEGKKFTSRQEVIDAVAARAESVIKTYAPQFKLSRQPTGRGKPNPNAVPTVSAGGGGGSGGRSQASAVEGPKGIEFFAEIGG